MSLMAESPADARRRTALRRMRLVALSLLLLAAVVFLATLRLDHGGVWGYVNTAAEAAMVGALADWFAVTALFRHPLGLPVPHTAIIPRRKNEIGRNLQEFVTENFLTVEIARERLAAADVTGRVGRWLGVARNRRRVLTEVVRVARAGLGRLTDDEVRSLVADVLVPRLVREPVSPIAGALLEGVVEESTHHGLVDLGLEQLHDWLRENPGTYADVLGSKAPWWTPPWLDDRVITWTYDQVLAWLREIRRDPRHPARLALDDLLRRLAHDLQHDADVMARAESLKERLLTHPQAAETAVGLWRSFRTSLETAMDDEHSYFHTRGDELLEHLGARFEHDPEWKAVAEARLGEAVSFVVSTYGEELAEVISVTVERWDAREASERIELHVGRDLQFIRINGTVVGALAGLVIHAVAQLLG
ncbi:membrane protein [Phycicoccus sp. DTK01]|nr:membrane protein [Phycicoccus sp. DTK01]